MEQNKTQLPSTRGKGDKRVSKIGKHTIYCWNCGAAFLESIHGGGKRKIKYCLDCYELKQLPCPKCFSKCEEKLAKELQEQEARE